MINRSELVTAALLGTDRRPPTFLGEVGDHDPATRLLDHSARSAVALRAGAVLPVVPSAPSGPLDPLIMAPSAAQAIMSRLLARPVPDLINLWLASAATRGLELVPPLWSAVISLAIRSAAVDRVLLARVLGPRGLWFCQQNPQWQRLATTLRSVRAEPVSAPITEQRLVSPDQVPQDPELDPIHQLRIEILQAFADHDHQELP
jgi:hypothetical protein